MTTGAPAARPGAREVPVARLLAGGAIVLLAPRVVLSPTRPRPVGRPAKRGAW